ncbi:efflux RND transporter periplasmic adaptor subunit [Shewanella avicenniae]|uniref:Efflux RND transporter periplasmic adaptor subunit n=1 Tax=Shewanella avicenniae TaxID=2814294 RepID=A0ABX7QSK0_9GAMM|nr:efflux RND transporter periplasmic adaptor subunit [Shewanella avicenniae]QSX34437.1 efflux RND transporter periplasmic adaptor subunit [Shewanella avicenniae]
MYLFLRRVLPPIVIVILTVAVIAALFATQKPPEKKPEEETLPVVNVVAADPQTVTLSIASYGTVNPKYRTQLVSEVQGRIEKIAPQFVAGGMVKQGDELAVIEPYDYQAALKQAEANLAQAQAALEEERARGEVAKVDFKGFSGVPPELGLRKPQLKQQQANVKYAEAELDRAKRNLERTVIRAPYDAIVSARAVNLGQYVTVGTNLGELLDTNVAEVRLPLANKELAYLESVDNPYTEVTLTTQLAGKNVSWQAHVVRSEGVVDPDNRMVYLVAEVQDPYLRHTIAQTGQLALKFGSFVDAEIRGRTLSNVVKLPRYMVRNNKVAVVNDENRIEMRSVKVVRTDLENVYLQDSLNHGDRVAETALVNMESGLKVKVAGDVAPSSKADDAEAAHQLAKAGNE